MKNPLITYRSMLVFICDLVVAMIAWCSAFLLRFNFEISIEYIVLLKQSLWLVLIVQSLILALFRFYRATWRFSSIHDLKNIFLISTISSFTLVILLFMITSNFRVSRSVFILYPILLIFLMGGVRLIYRMFKEHRLHNSFLRKGEPVIVFGAGAAAISLVKELFENNSWQVVSFLDDDKSLHGREILGIKVQGDITSLAKIAKRYNVTHVIIAMPSARYKERRKILEIVNQLGLEVLTVPAIDDLMSGRLNISQIHPVDVEDLLGRDAVDLDNSGLQHLISKNVILVSGAGGSIGSELCRQIIKFHPSHIICLDISEYALYQLEQDLSSRGLSIKLIYIVGDVRQAERLNKLLACYQPRIVFHSAAYKHVPLMENDNVSEAFSNNVIGTYTLAKACKNANVEKFVLISTDKAVNPTNIMGASKRLAEMVCHALQDENGTRFMIVRFGNVLGSSGSVIPKFREQIKMGGPITVTHPEITRYFMSIPEATQLVMQAALMGKGGEIFVLDMGEPVRIVDLAKDMIRLSGLEEDQIAIKFIGLRPGEKLYEELLADGEFALPTSHQRLRLASAKVVSDGWLELMLKWVSTTLRKDELIVKQELKKWVEEYVMSNF